MSVEIDETLEEIGSVYKVTDEVLADWSGEGNLQFPELLTKITLKMNWTIKQAREHDPIIRYYIRRNKNYHVTRGAYGGIMRASDKQKKELAKNLKDSVKKQMQAELAAKIAEITARTSISTPVLDEDDIFSDE